MRMLLLFGLIAAFTGSISPNSMALDTFVDDFTRPDSDELSNEWIKVIDEVYIAVDAPAGTSGEAHLDNIEVKIIRNFSVFAHNKRPVHACERNVYPEAPGACCLSGDLR